MSAELVVEITKLARDFGNRDFLEWFYRESLNKIGSDIDNIPVRLFKDIFRLANEFNDSELLHKLNQLTAED